MRSRGVEVGEAVLFEDALRVALMQNHDVIKALASYAPDGALTDRIDQRRAHGGSNDTGSGSLGDTSEINAELVIAIADDELRPSSKGIALRSC